MEDEDYTLMHYKDILKLNLKDKKHKLFIEDLSILDDFNLYDYDFMKKVCSNKCINRDSFMNELMVKFSSEIFMGICNVTNDINYWFEIPIKVLKLDDDEIYKLKGEKSLIADMMYMTYLKLEDYFDGFKEYYDDVVLEKAFYIGKRNKRLLGTFIVFEEDIKYE